jgi:hypothetical protein
MAPMYLDRWISFYMDINDELFAGTKEKDVESLRMKLKVTKAQVNGCIVNQIFHRSKPFVCKVYF